MFLQSAPSKTLKLRARTTVWILSGLLCFSEAATAATLTVAVASNFAETLEQLATEFEGQSSHRIVIARGSSGRHFAQILNGAPFDVFFSADAERPARLRRELGLPDENLRSYALGRLVLWGPGSEAAAAVRRRLESDSFNSLAIANPRLAPYGQAAAEALRALGIWNRLASQRGRLIRGENVAQAYQFVATGNADLGFVALSQVLSAEEGGFWELPQSLYQPIVQRLLVLQESTATQDLLQFLASDRARAIIRQAGYDVPPKD